MADKKISELTAATGVNYTDTVPIVQTGSTKKIAMSLFALRWNSSTSKWDANTSKIAGIANGAATDEALAFGQVLGSSAKSADYVVTDTDGIVTIYMTTGGSNRTVTLPTLADNQDRIINVIKVDSAAGYVTVDGEGAETIDGFANYVIRSQFGAVSIKARSTEWAVISAKESQWASYTPTFSAGFGTVASIDVRYKDDGTHLYIKGKFTTGTVAASTGSITLPTGYAIDTTAMPSIGQFGMIFPVTSSGSSISLNGAFGVMIGFYDTDTDKIWVATNTNAGNFQKSNMTDIATSSRIHTIDMKIPIRK